MKRFIKQVFLCMLALCVAWMIGFAVFFTSILGYADRSPPETPGDAIIVLTGGTGRLERGLRLFIDGKAPEMIITGVSENVTLEHILNLSAPKLKSALTPELRARIHLDHKAINTIGNALESAPIVSTRGYKTVLLVTSSYHMPRSMLEFHYAMPGVDFLPVAVAPEEWNGWQSEEARLVLLSEYHKIILAFARHQFLRVIA